MRRAGGAAIHQLGMEHVELTGGAGADLHRHPDARALIERQARRQQRQIAGIRSEITGQHLLVAFEAAARQDHRARAQGAQQPVFAADHHALNAAVRCKAEANRLCL